MTPKLRFFLVLFLLVAGFAAVGARPANACTCATFDTRRAVNDSPGAFVGRLEPPPAGVFPAPEDPQGTKVFRFEVEQGVKGPFQTGDKVDVRSASSPAACGLSASEGSRVGLILRREDERWFGSLCQQPDPERLLRAAQPLPTPDGSPPAGVVIESSYGVGRSFGLDTQGRLTSYGLGSGTTAAAAVCPQAARRADGTFPPPLLAELFFVPGEDGTLIPAVGVRNAESLVLVDELSLPDYAGAQPSGSIACRDAGGTDLVVVLGDVNLQKGRIVRVQNGTHRVVWDGPVPAASSFGPDGRVAWLNLGPNGEDLRRVALDRLDAPGPAPEAAPVASLPAGSGPMVASPDGRHLATVAVGTNQRSQVVLLDLEGATANDPPPIIRRTELSAAGVSGSMVWSTSDRVAFTPRLNRGELVRVFDTKLQPQAAWGDWAAEHSVATADGRLFGASQGKVWQASLLTGGPTLLREIEDALVYGLVDPTPSLAAVEPQSPPSSGSTTTTTATSARADQPAGTSSTTTTTSSRTDTTATTARPASENGQRPPGDTSTTAGAPDEQAGPVPTSAERERAESSGAGWPAFLAGMLAMGAVVGGVAWQVRVRRMTAGEPAAEGTGVGDGAGPEGRAGDSGQ